MLVNRRQDLGDGADLLARLVAAWDPGIGAKMSDSLITDNVVTFLVGQETTAQALSWALYVRCFQIGRRRCAKGCAASAWGLWVRISSSSLVCWRQCFWKRCGFTRRPPALTAYRRLGLISVVRTSSLTMSRGSRQDRGMEAGKCTAVDLFGVERARRKSRDLQARSLSHRERFGRKADWLRSLVTEATWKAS